MNEKIVQARKQNMKLYSLYKSISLDLIFYYAIEYLFLTEAKGFSPSNAVLGGAFYASFMIFLQIPGSFVVDRIGARKSTILANVFNVIFIILIMFTNNIKMLAIAQFVSALCFSLKNVSDKTLIQFSIPEGKKKGEIFSRIEGKGTKNYYIINAVTSLLAGFLYIINPYLPMVCSLLFTIAGLFISLGFADVEELKSKEKGSVKKERKKYAKDLKGIFKYIANSKRLRSLFLYSGISWGIYSLMTTYRSSLMVELGSNPQSVTAIAAIAGIAAAIGSHMQLKIHKTFRNKSLSLLLIIVTISTLTAGITGVSHISYKVALLIITICISAIFFSKGVYEVLVSRYLSNFTNEKVLSQIYAIDETFRNGSKAIICLLGSYLLEITNTSNALILVGIMLIIISCGLISYMKVRLGLKPEEYDKNEVIVR